MLYWYTFRPSFYALVYVCALFPIKETAFVYHGKRGFLLFYEVE